MKFKRLSLYGCFIFFVAQMFATQVTMKLEKVAVVDGLPTVGVGKPFVLHVTVEGSDDQSPDIDVDGLHHFDKYGVTGSRAVTIGNNAMVSRTTRSYTLAARVEGEFVIGPARVSDGGGEATSELLTVRVLQDAPAGSSGASVGQQAVRVQARLRANKQRIVVGEPVTLTLEILRKGDISRMGVPSLKFQGFSHHEIEGTRSGQKMVDGEQYDVIEKDYVLIPQQPGTLNIESINVTYLVPIAQRPHGGFFDHSLFGSFFGQRAQQRQVRTNALSVTVEPLPTGRGAIEGVGFFSSFALSVDKTNVEVNEPISVVVELVGRGNLDQIVAPRLKLPGGFRSFDSKSDVCHNFAQGFGEGSKRFEYVVQVSKAGTHSIPSQEFSYFDTQARRVKKLKTLPVEINVNMPAGEVQQVQQQSTGIPDPARNDSLEPQTVKGEDIHFIEQEYVAPSTPFKLPWWLFIVLLLLMPYAVGLRTPGAIKETWSWFFTLFARKKNMHEEFEGKRAELQRQDNCSQLYALFLELFSRAIRKKVAAVDEAVIEKYLIDLGWAMEQRMKLMDFLNVCAHKAFGRGEVKAQELMKIHGEAQYWISYICEGKVPPREKKEE